MHITNIIPYKENIVKLRAFLQTGATCALIVPLPFIILLCYTVSTNK